MSDFRKELETEWKGSLVRVNYIRKPRAKEYLNRLAKEGAIEKVSWGWYWIPAKIQEPLDFLRKDKNFKMISSQTAASFWNGDFVHRDVYIVKVKDKSYGKALEKFGEGKGWKFQTNATKEKLNFETINGLRVESMERTVVDCLKSYAFEDAFATLYSNKDKIDVKKMERKYYWDRLPHSEIRLRQILGYYWAKVTGKGSQTIEDDYIRRNMDDALDKVIAFG